jgi:hypothetical protein
MRARRIVLAVILGFSLLTAGCLRDVVREFAKHATEVNALNKELTKKFGDEVLVTMNQAGDRVALNVTFINSPLNDKTKEDRAARAQETANVVRMRYLGINSLNAIWVVFVRETKTFVFVDERQSVDYYGFDKQGLRVSSATSYSANTTSSGVELRTASTYIENDKETDISVSGIQLAGKPGGNGLTLLPHFRLAGDARSINAPPPKIVTLDFASYSDHEEFPRNTRVEFIADGKSLLQTKATFTVSKTQGAVNEFLYLNVPYRTFRKMLDANQLSIRLNDDIYPLTPTQFATMKEMLVFVNE